MFEVRLSPNFQRDFKKLIKKYRRLADDLDPLIEALQAGDFSAHNAIKGFSHRIYKARIRSRDQVKGQSGGFRVIYYVVTKDQDIILLTIYAKARQADINAATIKSLLEDLA